MLHKRRGVGTTGFTAGSLNPKRLARVRHSHPTESEYGLATWS